MAIYNVLKRLIEKGETAGLEEKIDVFYAAGKLDTAQYNELMAMLKNI